MLIFYVLEAKKKTKSIADFEKKKNNLLLKNRESERIGALPWVELNLKNIKILLEKKDRNNYQLIYFLLKF